ncbi:hypothetical protein ABZU53_29960, partial [Micromonospora sp. NPDC005194]|uniref:hypothetical protein n=1 Tax=Micromonospora sp. NPDC005194 TaxID=3156870 RepID=UPI0033A1A7CE
VIIWDCNGQSNQRWRLNADGSITGVGSGRCDISAHRVSLIRSMDRATTNPTAMFGLIQI